VTPCLELVVEAVWDCRDAGEVDDWERHLHVAREYDTKAGVVDGGVKGRVHGVGVWDGSIICLKCGKPGEVVSTISMHNICRHSHLPANTDCSKNCEDGQTLSI
jgi:hypothetical protein